MSKPTKTNHNSLLIKALGDRPIAFSRMVAELGGGATAGLFLCQLLYWWEKGADKNWIYKTIEEFKEETCLTYSEQKRAIKAWTELGVLKVEVRGIPGTRHFHINIEKLGQHLDSRKHARTQQDTTKQFAGFNKVDRTTGQSTTESTPEKTYKDTVIQPADAPTRGASGGDPFQNHD
jgi:hypothetical protein